MDPFYANMARLCAQSAMAWFDLAARASTPEDRAERLAFADEHMRSAEMWAHWAG
jgi:hypothetical protein